MFHYRPSSRSQDYTPYLPRRSYFPASFDIDGAPSPAHALEDFGYPSVSHSFLPPPMDAETRYRRALHELEAAEQEYQAHMALERARQSAAIRQRAAAEAARREREIALYAEIERLKRARALQEQVEERLAPRQRALRNPVTFDRAHCGRHALMRGIYGDAERDPVPQRHSVRPQPSNETSTIGDLLDLLTGVHPEPQRASPPQRLTSPTPSQLHHPAEPHTKPEPPEHENAEVNLNNMLEFLHSIAIQARGAAGGEQSSHEQSLPSQPEAIPVDGKGKGKVKAQPVPEPTLFESLFGDRVSGARDQELRDVEYAIKLSLLQDRNATDIKKAHAFKASQSSSGGTSSKVKVEDPSSSGRAASSSRSAISSSVPLPVPEPISPLTSIRAVRTQFSALESAFNFPPVLDFDHSELAVTSNNAPVRAYEYALNDLLERLDAIESDGNEEVRDVRREVVREVERALEEVERKVKEQAPQAAVPEVTKQEASHVESEDRGASTTQAAPSAVVHVTEAAKPKLPNFAPVASQADADIVVGVSAECQSASPVATASRVVVAERDTVAEVTPANEEVSTPSVADTETVPVSDDASESIATITPAPVTPAVPAHSSSNKSASTSAAAAETFLTSLSHDQFTFPPRPAFAQSSTNSGVPHDDDAVLVDNSSEGGSARGVDDGWTTEFDA